MKPITVIGGGLAGLTLGIGLRQKNVPVRIFEAGTYPRHRVCGEFISGRGHETLRRLCLLDDLYSLGAQAAHGIAFFSQGAWLGSYKLRTAATCISRSKLDAFLAKRFIDLGGELNCGERRTTEGKKEGEVCAAGRVLHPTTNGWRWFGLKAHASNVELSADLELHFVRNGYVGICRLTPDLVNVCGLFRNQPGEGGFARDWKAQLSGPRGAPVFERLQSARWCDDTFAATSGLRYSAAAYVQTIGCAIGDAFTLIAPMTGNGMSIAFESAEIALTSLAAYAQGERQWCAVSSDIRQQLRGRFARRITYARFFQHLAFRPFAASHVLPRIFAHPRVLDFCYRLTH